LRQQLACGIDIINDGEVGKISYATYVKDRLTGFAGEGALWPIADLQDFPHYAARLFGELPLANVRLPTCTGPITYRDPAAVRQDLAQFTAALQGVSPVDTFLTAASPGVISLFLKNTYYPSHEAYLAALADAMKVEYDAIAGARFVLQVDCPDLAAGRHTQFAALSLAEFRQQVALHVEALNHALRDIPPERLRLHLCWGNYEGPHHRDVPLREILDLVLTARPVALSFEAANPRHAHEWAVFQEVVLPPEKVVIPGVLDSTTNYIEHPELVAERICRYAQIVGREQVIAGTDCGFSTFAGPTAVDPQITWAKLRALAEGARLATQRLW
jgi:5-methyltetrahydropteroyltriglutamate--homocysteine methyltransferase